MLQPLIELWRQMVEGETQTESNSSPLHHLKLGIKGLRSTFTAKKVQAESVEPSASTSQNSEASAGSSFFAVIEKARKAAYEMVPQSEPSTGGELADEEMGEVQPQWNNWAKAAAEKVRQQVAEAAEVSQKGLAKGLEKAKSVEWGDQVTRGIGRLGESASQASSKLADTGKAASQIAKDVQGKGAQKFADAASASAKKAREAKEKAANVAGSAKDKLAQAGSSLSGLTALTLSPIKLAQFGGVFLLGIFLISISFSFLPVLVIAPQKFALLFAFGSMTLLSSFAVLKGPHAFFSQLIEKEKLPLSISYAVGLVGTLGATIIMKSYLLTALFGIIQFFALLYFLASYVPGGQTVLNLCGRLAKRLTQALFCRQSK